MWNSWQQGHRCAECTGLKKYTINFVRGCFEKQGYILLSEKYENNIKNLKYICPEGHIGNISFNSWQQGHRCNECAGRKKYTIKFIRGEFEKEKYMLLSEEYINAHQKLEYICPKGHRGVIKWNTWQRGQRCAKCFGNNKPVIKFIREQFEKEGYKLLTTNYVNSKQKLEYICSSGHEGKIMWSSWQQGCRCLECSGYKKLTIDFIKKEFKKERYCVLTKTYVNRHQRLKYICPKGHYRITTWANWLKGQRCRKCCINNNKGNNHYNWNPNLSNEERIKERNYLEYTNWAMWVKERDNFTCQICGQVGGNLVSHHLESYNNNPKLRTALSNGVCLCKNCHNNFHHNYGYGNNTRKQFIEFVDRCNNRVMTANV